MKPRLGSPPWTAVLHDWVTTVDHKKIGIMYILMSLVFLVIAGCEALLMRWQLFYPRNDFLGPDTFNQLFTMHGTTMVFFVGMPILIGIGNYLVPLMIGARDMAFPAAERLWLLGRRCSAACWSTSASPPAVPRPSAGSPMRRLTERTFARGPATDFWALGLIVSGIGTLDRRHQLHRHDPGDACPGHGAAQGAVLHLDDALDLGADRAGHSAA